MKMHLTYKNGKWCAWHNKDNSKYGIPITSGATLRECLTRYATYKYLDVKVTHKHASYDDIGAVAAYFG